MDKIKNMNDLQTHMGMGLRKPTKSMFSILSKMSHALKIIFPASSVINLMASKFFHEAGNILCRTIQSLTGGEITIWTRRLAFRGLINQQEARAMVILLRCSMPRTCLISKLILSLRTAQLTQK